MNRADIDLALAAIDSERAYQNNLGPDRTDGQKRTVGDYILMASYYAETQPRTSDTVRKVAGIITRCLEEWSEKIPQPNRVEIYTDAINSPHFNGAVRELSLRGVQHAHLCGFLQVRDGMQVARANWVRNPGNTQALETLEKLLAYIIALMSIAGVQPRQ